MNRSSVFEKVYEIVERIPAGKVATYGQISEFVNNELRIMNYGERITPRVIGWALHANRDPKIPCHRVVNIEGKVADNFGGPSTSLRTKDLGSFGWKEQKMRLIEEGVRFKDKMHVDLERFLWRVSP